MIKWYGQRSNTTRSPLLSSAVNYFALYACAKEEGGRRSRPAGQIQTKCQHQPVMPTAACRCPYRHHKTTKIID